MARMRIKMPEELLTKLSKLGNQYDGIVQSITITERRYVEMETDTGYHHYIFGLESIQNYEED